MRWLPGSLVFAIVLAIVACAHHPASKAPILAVMERSPCLGECPVYTVTVYEDGVVEYEGRWHVKREGFVVADGSLQMLRAIRHAFARADFVRLADHSQPRCTDQPTVKLTYRGRTIKHDHGDPSAPERLFVLEDSIDRILDTRRWVGRGWVYFPACGDNP